jgi:hypothetical protein
MFFFMGERRQRTVGRPSGSGERPVEWRACRRHGDTEFVLYGCTRPRWRCKRCVGEAVTRRKRRVRATLLAAAGGRCAICGYGRCSQSLHFHHVDPGHKRLELGSHRGAALATFLLEIDKCVLLCANCHGEVEAGLVLSPPPGAIFRGTPLIEGGGSIRPLTRARQQAAP